MAIPRNREIGFVSFSFRACRACERAGEAKLCERMSDDVLIVGAPWREFPRVRGQLALIFVHRHVGFKSFCPILGSSRCVFCVQACGF